MVAPKIGHKCHTMVDTIKNEAYLDLESTYGRLIQKVNVIKEVQKTHALPLALIACRPVKTLLMVGRLGKNFTRHGYNYTTTLQIHST